APNEGDLQLLVEGIVVMEVVQYDPVLLVSMPDGDITIGARLVNNDGSELTPSAAASVAIHVAASSAVSLPLVSNGGIARLLAGGFAQTATPNTVVTPLPSGPHAIRWQLEMNHGSALNPDVTASVEVMVTRGPATGAPGLSIVSPREGALLGTDSTVSFRVTNFVLVPAGGPAGVPNEGRIRVRLDGANYSELTDPSP